MFVSSDRDQKSFNEYYGEMPFLAVPFAARDVKEALGDKYGVRGSRSSRQHGEPSQKRDAERWTRTLLDDPLHHFQSAFLTLCLLAGRSDS